jgi:AcrR family transcriptional regulator
MAASADKTSTHTGTAPSSRDAFIRTAGKLFRAQGYHATGLNQIVVESHAPKGSLYFHFPGGKEELATVAITEGGARLRDAIEAVLATSKKPEVAIGNLIDAMAAGLTSSDYRYGCPVATVTLEAAATSAPIQQAASAVYRSWLEPIEQHLVAAGVPRKAAQRKASVVLSALEGALLLARSERDTAPLDALKRELKHLLRPS